MLSNQRYADALFYTPHDKRTDLENEFSDYVAKVTHLGELQMGVGEDNIMTKMKAKFHLNVKKHTI